MSRFAIVNGEIVEKEEINLSHLFWENRVEITQKCWFGFGGIPLLNENMAILKQQLDAVKIPLPDFFQNKRELFRLTKRMLNKNKFYRSGLIQFTIFNQNNTVSSLITSQAFKIFELPFSENGVLVNYSALLKQAQNPLNNFRFFNQPLWKTAQAKLNNTLFQNSIFLNENHAVCDSINANIFLVKSNQLITPALSTGCYNDVLRNIILQLGAELNLKVIESENIQQKEVLEMDEIFIAGEEIGIQWLLGVETKRYVHYYSTIIHEKVNEFLKAKVN